MCFWPLFPHRSSGCPWGSNPCHSHVNSLGLPVWHVAWFSQFHKCTAHEREEHFQVWKVNKPQVWICPRSCLCNLFLPLTAGLGTHKIRQAFFSTYNKTMTSEKRWSCGMNPETLNVSHEFIFPQNFWSVSSICITLKKLIMASFLFFYKSSLTQFESLTLLQIYPWATGAKFYHGHPRLLDKFKTK